MIRQQTDLTIVGEAGTVGEAVAKARELKPDLILLDYSLPDGNGPDAARAILAEQPDIGIVFLTIHEADTYLLAAIRSGAMGYLVKDISFARLVDAIQAISRKEPVLSPRLTLSLMHEISHPRVTDDFPQVSLADFTPREIDILRALAVDSSNQEIAEYLSISVAAVKNKIHEIFHKLNLNNRKEVAIFARRRGLGRIELS